MNVFNLVLLFVMSAHITLPTKDESLDLKDAYFEVEVTGPNSKMIRFVVSAFTKVGYSKSEGGIYGKLAETGEEPRSFNLFFPGKEVGTFAFGEQQGQATLMVHAADLFDEVYAGQLVIEVVEKTRLKGSFTGKVMMPKSQGSEELVEHEVKGRFLLPAYIR